MQHDISSTLVCTMSLRRRELVPNVESRREQMAAPWMVVCCGAYVRFCAGFWMPAITKEPRAQLAGVQKAPRHEVAGSWAPAKQRALWRFNAGADVDDGRGARTTPA